MTRSGGATNVLLRRHGALALTAALMLALVPLRLARVPPTIFFEGDDAALCTAIARLSTDADLGPYFFHSRPVAIADPAAAIARLEAQREPSSIRFYRYDTMPGMYFLGYVTRHLAGPTTRMAWACFLAGTLAPLLFALFFVRFFRASAPVALPLCYVAIATAPEQWVSGSAYINDKIVASACLAGALYFVTLSAQRRQGHAVSLLIGGALLGLAATMRFDTALLFPTAVLVVWMDSRSPQRAALRCLALCAAGAAVYGGMCGYMHAPLPLRTISAGELSFRHTQSLLSMIASAFGPIRLLVFAASLVALSAATLGRRRGGRRELRRRSLPVLWMRVGVALTLVVPEVTLLWALPQKSQKYVLIGSSVVSGLCALIPLALWERVAASHRHARRGLAAVAAAIGALMAADATFTLGVADSGTDGPRLIGGHFRLHARERGDSAEVRALFARLSEAGDGFRAEIVVAHPTWTMEQSIAYYAVTQGWKNSVVPTAVQGVDSTYVTVNRYAHPSSDIALLVPSDGESLGLDALRAVAEKRGRPVYVFGPGVPLSPVVAAPH